MSRSAALSLTAAPTPRPGPHPPGAARRLNRAIPPLLRPEVSATTAFPASAPFLRTALSAPLRRRLLSAALLLPLLLLAAACGDSGSASRLAPLPAGARVLAFGDSLTYGTGAGGLQPQPGASYPEVLARETGWKVVNSGAPGETTERGLARLPGVLSRERPALVLLEHGGNDFLRGLPEAATERNLAAMIRACREAGAQVLLLGVPRPGLAVRLHPVYQRVAEAARVPLEPDLLPTLLADGSIKSDPLHLNLAGYAKLALGLAATLRKLGALP